VGLEMRGKGGEHIRRDFKASGLSSKQLHIPSVKRPVVFTVADSHHAHTKQTHEHAILASQSCFHPICGGVCRSIGFQAGVDAQRLSRRPPGTSVVRANHILTQHRANAAPGHTAPSLAPEKDGSICGLGARRLSAGS